MSKNFSIKETVNKNIEKNQFPSFSNYRSMAGWCSMNYPKNLVNPIYMDKQTGVPDQKKYELDSLFQKKNPTERQKVQFIKPLSNLPQKSPEEKVQQNQQNVIKPNNIKISSHTLASTSHKVKSKIFEENQGIAQEYSAVRPLNNYLGSDKDGNYERKIRQIGQVTYVPAFQNEEMRHLKKMPKTVVDEQNLMQILNPNLEYLNLQYKTDISNDLIDKIGYLAPNIKSLNLTALPITNKVIIQLGKSCKKLEQIDISKCSELEEFAIISFLKDCQNLKRFAANHLNEAITDACLQCMADKQMKSLQINFCDAVTSTGIQFLQGKQFQRLYLSSIPNLKHDDFSKLIASSNDSLKEVDLSFNTIPQINNALMTKLGWCTKLQQIIITGCQKINDDGINLLMNGQKAKLKPNEGLANLKTLKVGGVINLSDKLHTVFKKCPLLSFLEANNLQRLTDNFLQQLKTLPGKKTILINFTPNITDEKINEIAAANKQMKIIRTISKMTDPADDGLRMPIPPASLKIKKPKKKKK